MGFTPITDDDIAPASSGGFNFTPISESDIAHPLASEATQFEKGASGFLSGLAGLGDLGGFLTKYLVPGAAVSPVQETAGDQMRGLLDAATGVENSTRIGEDSWAYKAGEYLPGVLMGPGSIGLPGANGVLNTVQNLATSTGLKNISKLLAADAALSGAGDIGESLGGEAGEATAAIATALLPAGARKLATGLGANPSQAESLLKAFKISDAQAAKAAPVLEALAEQRIVTAPKSANPFADIATNLDDAQKISRKSIATALDGKSTTVADIWPESSLFNKKILAGADTDAATLALKAEHDNLTKLALLKNNPVPKGVDPLIYGDELLAEYKKFEKAAKAGDEAAQAIVQEMDSIIDRTPITGQELWDLRQSYDGLAKWNRVDPKGKAQAYRAFRDAAQKKLLEIADPEAKKLFEDFSAQMQGQKLIEKMKGAEDAGRTQAPGLIGKAVELGLRKPLGYIAPALARPTAPETALKQAFGKTFTQRVLGLTPETRVPSNVTGPGLAGSPVSTERARTISSESAKTSNSSPSYRYNPSMSEADVLADPSFISHYENTTKEAGWLDNLIKDVGKGRKTAIDVKKLKTAAGKIIRKVSGGKPGYTEKDLGDLIRGAVFAKDNDDAARVLRELQKKDGVVSGEVENYFRKDNPWGYKGVNVNVKSPNGALGEIQIHTPESERVKKAIRPLYDKWREADAIPSEVFAESKNISAKAIKEEAPKMLASVIATRVSEAAQSRKGNNFIDKAMTKAEKKLAGTPEAPVVISAKRVSPEKVDQIAAVMPSLWTQESSGNPNAVSKAGAKGIGQLMDATGRELFSKYKNILPKEVSDKYDPFNEAQNKILSSLYMQELLKKYDGDLELALTAYNQGMGRVDRLLKIHNATTLAEIRPYLGPDGKKYASSIMARLKKQGIKV